MKTNLILLCFRCLRVCCCICFWSFGRFVILHIILSFNIICYSLSALSSQIKSEIMFGSVIIMNVINLFIEKYILLFEIHIFFIRSSMADGRWPHEIITNERNYTKINFHFNIQYDCTTRHFHDIEPIETLTCHFFFFLPKY